MFSSAKGSILFFRFSFGLPRFCASRFFALFVGEPAADAIDGWFALDSSERFFWVHRCASLGVRLSAGWVAFHIYAV